MFFLKKRKNTDENFDDYYDANGYFIGGPANDEYSKEHYNNYSEDEDEWESKDDYYCDDDFDSCKTRSLQTVNIKIITFLFLYIAFLFLGIFNTTFKGHEPQIINAKIRSERTMYKKMIKFVVFSEKANNDLQDLDKRSYQEKIPPLQSTLKKVSKKIDSLNEKAYKVKEEDFLKAEMLYMVSDLLKTQMEGLQLEIELYQYATIGVNDLELSELASEVYSLYLNKMQIYKERFEDIKIYELHLY